MPTLATFQDNIEKRRKRRPAPTSFGDPIDLRATLAAMPVGKCFEVDEEYHRDHALVMGKRMGLTLSSEKRDGRFAIWRDA